MRGEVIAELAERLVQLVGVDRTGTVAVKVAVDVLPVLDVLPQARELVEADRPAPVSVLRARESERDEVI